MNKKLVWIVLAIVVVLAIILIATTGDKESPPEGANPEGNLPGVDEVQYNALATSNDDFTALDKGLNALS